MQLSTSNLIVPEASDVSTYGDFIDPDDYDILEHYSENMDEHEYYPICPGEIVEKRYRVVHKLGHGAFSTVWLAHDLQKKVDVALKIMTADCEWNHEFRMQNEIIRHLKDTDTSNLLLYQDTFSLPGRDRDRDHRVLVLPVRGPSLSSPHTDRMSMATRMSAAKQLLKALESLHRCGIIHGDVSGGNVLWDMVPLDKYNTATKYKYLGRPKKAALQPGAWKAGELVSEAKIPQSLLRAKVYLSDFGLATDANNQIMNKWRPTWGYCAPERMHKFPASFAGDMWGYMCIFMSLYFRHSIFDRGLDAIVTALGPMPKEWKGLKEKPEDEWYDQNMRVDTKEVLERMFKLELADVSTAERGHIISIILAVLRYRPGERLTATQLLHHPSFKAVMNMYCP
ncbi:hypothetical protein CIRG_02575 [Coccidioides immitis RMSCC 2394]|uniref:Protein kinase domain-containing protein n=1 Tax=Coccidioides immitis RMSCC 2394 TaxID=404692 RepID=A0A0J6Y857_COCIT|nr:hypothetical protein CIRG_02575 [Coccidioides immitis RMSCC 2394]